MAVKQHEWVASEWARPGVELWRRSGDFAELSDLIVQPGGRELARVPGWAAYMALFAAGQCDDVHFILYDVATAHLVFVGRDGAVLYAFEPEAAARHQLTAAVDDIGGLYPLNVLNWGGHFYVIGDDGDVYRGADFKAALAVFYNGADAHALVAWGDRVYLATTAGVILNVNDADNAFEAFYTPLDSVDVVFMTPFRGYLLIAALSADGTLVFYRLTASAQFSTGSTLPSVSGLSIGRGARFVVHGDDLYFTPGYIPKPNGVRRYDIYRFNGSQVEMVTQIEDVASGAAASGLLTWNDWLVFYEQTHGAGGVTKLRVLLGDEFVTLTSQTAAANVHIPLIASVAGQMVITADVVVPATIGYYTFNEAGASDLQDGYVVTSRLDMGHPGRQKRLLRLTVLLDGAAADFDVIIKYRTDDTAGWTTAVTSDDTRRVTVDITTAVRFYTLQLRIDLDDDTGNDEDFRIEAVSVVYSITG